MEIFDETIKAVWNRHANHYDEKHNRLEDQAVWKKILLEQIGTDKKQTVLDMGTGTGFLAQLVAEAGYRSMGIDFAEKMVAQARINAQTKHLDIEYMVADWNQLPFENNSIDVIVNRLIMWAVFLPEKTLTEWYRVLKPGGRILCFCPENTKEKLPPHYDLEIEKQLPLRDATPRQFGQALTATGYQRIEITALPQLSGDKLFECWALIKGEKEIIAATN